MARSLNFLGLACSVAAAVALFACGGSQPAAEAPAAPAAPSAEAPAPAAPSAEAPAAPAPAAEAPAPAAPAAAAPAPAPAPIADTGWKDDMPTKDKAAFMKAKVMPAMSKVFKDYDAKAYANFSCKTCHGKDMKPKPMQALPELHFKDGKMAEAEKKPEVAKFMHEKVTPAMAALFGKPTFDPKTMQGFGCMGCHKVNM